MMAGSIEAIVAIYERQSYEYIPPSSDGDLQDLQDLQDLTEKIKGLMTL